MEQQPPEKKKSVVRRALRIVIAVFGLMAMCFCALLIWAIRETSTPEWKATATARVMAEAARVETAEAATETAMPTKTSLPTATPLPPTATPLPPTNTPLPTNTPGPSATPGPPTETPLPTDTPLPPTDTPLPTDTPVPTSTPLPTDTPVPTSTPVPTATATPNGNSREEAAAPGQMVAADDIGVVVVQVSEPTQAFLRRANMFNPGPEDGERLLMITVSATCLLSSDRRCFLNPSDFELFGSAGIVHHRIINIVGVDNELDSVEFFGDATTEGWMAFVIEADETDLVLHFSPTLFGSGVYLQVSLEDVEILQ